MIDLDKIYKINLELHSFCNLDCRFCLNVFNSNHKKKINISHKTLTYALNFISTLSNIKMICLSGHNQPITNKYDLCKINILIKYFKRIFPGVKIKLCSNSSFLKIVDILNDVNYDILYLTKYEDSDLNIFDIINLLKNNIDVKFNKKYNLFLINCSNKKIIWKDFTKQKFGKSNMYLKNMGGKFNFLNTYLSENVFCDRNELYIDYNGNINLCCNTNACINSDLIIGNVLNYKNIKSPNLNNSWCKKCDAKKTYEEIILKEDDFIKIKM